MEPYTMKVTPGPWILDPKRSEGPTMYLWREDSDETRRVPWDLAAAAPDLAAEVERLRGALLAVLTSHDAGSEHGACYCPGCNIIRKAIGK